MFGGEKETKNRVHLIVIDCTVYFPFLVLYFHYFLAGTKSRGICGEEYAEGNMSREIC